MTIFRYPFSLAKRSDSSASSRPIPEQRNLDLSHVPIVATWDIDDVGRAESKSIRAIVPSISAMNNTLRLPSDEMKFRSCSSEKGLSKIVYFCSAMTELMTSMISFASSAVARRIVIFIQILRSPRLAAPPCAIYHAMPSKHLVQTSKPYAVGIREYPYFRYFLSPLNQMIQAKDQGRNDFKPRSTRMAETKNQNEI